MVKAGNGSAGRMASAVAYRPEYSSCAARWPTCARPPSTRSASSCPAPNAPRRRSGGCTDAAAQGARGDYSFTRRSRSALLTTLTDDSAMAAAAMIGDSRMPKAG